jgi:hypothetical protein
MQERLAWDHAERTAARVRRNAGRSSGDSDTIAVTAPNATAAQHLRSALASPDRPVEMQSNGRRWTVSCRPGSGPDSLTQTLNVIQTWVDETAVPVELAVGDRTFTMRPR